MLEFYEFFAGAGMARAGLGAQWRGSFANDIDEKKSSTYEANWGNDHFVVGDVAHVTTAQLPGTADLAWASFPCQDLSLAGGGAGLKGGRSGTFWPFWNLMKGLGEENRAPRMVVLENVCGTLTSHDGKDFATICNALQQSEYALGAIVIDAALFVPQSRPRLFVIAVHESIKLPAGLTAEGPLSPWHTRTLQTAHAKLPPKTRRSWLWWKLPPPPKRKTTFAD